MKAGEVNARLQREQKRRPYFIDLEVLEQTTSLIKARLVISGFLFKSTAMSATTPPIWRWFTTETASMPAMKLMGAGTDTCTPRQMNMTSALKASAWLT